MRLDYKKGKHDFYFIHILKVDEDICDYGESWIATKLSGFTINESLMKLYKSFYGAILEKCECVETVIKNVEYKEFADIIKRDFDMEMNEDFRIEYGPIDLLDKGIVYTSLLANDVWEYDSEMGYFEDTTNLTYFEANELLRLNYLRLTEDTELIYKLIIRLVNFYVPLLDVVGWFSYEVISDSVKVMLTKYFDLPAPLETYDFYDIFCAGYRILAYLNDNVNLTGDYPQDE